MSNAIAPSRFPGERNPTRAIALLLATVSTALHLGLAFHLAAVGAVDQYDVFFHADTQARLACVVDLVCDHRSSFSHPALDLFVNLPVRSLAWGASALGAFGADIEAARRGIALMLSPLAAGLQSALVFLLLIELGLSRLNSLLASTLASISLSALLFGSIPESFALSGVAITGGLLAAVRAQQETRWTFARWVALSVFAMGVTITNLASLLVLYAVGRRIAGDDAQRIARRTAGLALATLGITFVLASFTVAIYDMRPLNFQEGERYITKWSEGNDRLARFAQFPTALVNSVAGVPPDRAPNYQGQINDSRYKFRFTFDTTPGAFSGSRPLAWLLLMTSLLGGIVLARGDTQQRCAAAASLLILAGNALLHSFWGVGHFLYSQHWQPVFCLLLAGPLFLRGRARVAGAGLVAAITLAVAAQNWTVWRVILAHFSLPPVS